MSDSIEPAIDAKTWGEIIAAGGPAKHNSIVADAAPDEYAFCLALFNAALPDDDPRKITWAMVDDLRDMSRRTTTAGRRHQIADALASYLPPREP